MPRIFPLDINSLQESAASLLSCAPNVEREMPPPDARSCRIFNQAAAKSSFPQCAYQWSENTAKLQETRTRPICMHTKTPVTSVTCGIRGRRFYLALFSHSSPAALVDLPFGAPWHAATHCTTPHLLQSYGARKSISCAGLTFHFLPAVSAISRFQSAQVRTKDVHGRAPDKILSCSFSYAKCCSLAASALQPGSKFGELCQSVSRQT